MESEASGGRVVSGSDSAFPKLGDLRTTGKRYYAEYSAGGLTKRELFAAMAMQGLICKTNVRGEAGEYADAAVECADALIAALEREPQPAGTSQTKSYGADRG
jgi:hypothetical protein